MQVNETHRAELRSWVESANATDTDFPIQNLPFGMFRRDGESPRAGVAIGDQILDLTAALKAGLFEGEAEAAARLATGQTLNDFMAADPRLHTVLRRRLSQLLAADNPDRGRLSAMASSLLVPMDDAQLELPALIGSFTDFLTSIYHTERGGRVTRPDSPVPAPFRYLPIAYNGRATSVRASGEPVRRPNGQWRTAEGKVEFGPCRQLDFELELGTFVGRGNELGEPISIEEAPDRIFGFCLLNDWSARDVQRWESALGPFLSKSLSTTISCWVVTAEALAPFRAPGVCAAGRRSSAPALSLLGARSGRGRHRSQSGRVSVDAAYAQQGCACSPPLPHQLRAYVLDRRPDAHAPHEQRLQYAPRRFVRQRHHLRPARREPGVSG